MTLTSCGEMECNSFKVLSDTTFTYAHTTETEIKFIQWNLMLQCIQNILQNIERQFMTEKKAFIVAIYR